MSEHHSRYGTRRALRPAADLYEIPYREAADDGREIVHAGDHTPTCADCGVGRLLWAEAGYVPWHRICEVCGSHWQLYPVTWGPARPRPAPPRYWRTGAYRCGHQPEDRYWCDECQDEPIPLVELVTPPELVRWVDGRGEVELDPTELVCEELRATWGDIVGLIRPEHWTEAEREAGRMAGMVVVPCALARRARFYSR